MSQSLWAAPDCDPRPDPRPEPRPRGGGSSLSLAFSQIQEPSSQRQRLQAGLIWVLDYNSAACFYRALAMGRRPLVQGACPSGTGRLLDSPCYSIIPPHHSQKKVSSVSLSSWGSQTENPSSPMTQEGKESLPSPIRCRSPLISPPITWTLNKRRPAPQNTPKVLLFPANWHPAFVQAGSPACNALPAFLPVFSSLSWETGLWLPPFCYLYSPPSQERKWLSQSERPPRAKRECSSPLHP